MSAETILTTVILIHGACACVFGMAYYRKGDGLMGVLAALCLGLAWPLCVMTWIGERARREVEAVEIRSRD